MSSSSLKSRLARLEALVPEIDDTTPVSDLVGMYGFVLPDGFIEHEDVGCDVGRLYEMIEASSKYMMPTIGVDTQPL